MITNMMLAVNAASPNSAATWRTRSVPQGSPVAVQAAVRMYPWKARISPRRRSRCHVRPATTTNMSAAVRNRVGHHTGPVASSQVGTRARVSPASRSTTTPACHRNPVTPRTSRPAIAATAATAIPSPIPTRGASSSRGAAAMVPRTPSITTSPAVTTRMAVRSELCHGFSPRADARIRMRVSSRTAMGQE